MMNVLSWRVKVGAYSVSMSDEPYAPRNLPSRIEDDLQGGRPSPPLSRPHVDILVRLRMLHYQIRRHLLDVGAVVVKHEAVRRREQLRLALYELHISTAYIPWILVQIHS